MQVGTTAPGECSCAGQVGRLALYPFALFWPTKYRGEGRGESEEKGRGNGQRGERERARRFVRVFAHLFSKTREREGRHGSEGGGGGGGGGVVRSSLCGGGDGGGGEGREGWLYPRMIPRLSRAGFNVLAGSAPESRGRQPSSHQPLHTRACIYGPRVRVCTRVCTYTWTRIH